MDKKIQVGIIGATGFTGSELARILLRHPKVNLAAISSETHAGRDFSEVHPMFRNIFDLPLVTAKDLLADENIEILFLALPHGVSMEFVRDMDTGSRRIIDLSADFRLDSDETYNAWYPKSHVYPQGFKRSVYGVPELFEDEIRNSDLIGNPGCYPTATILGLAPLAYAGVIDPDIIVDAKSGVTGAGVKPKETNHFSNVHSDFKAYGLPTHRHTIEMEQTLNKLNKKDHRIQFTPHLLPVDRGILATIYCRSAVKPEALHVEELFREFYKDKPFIRWRSFPPAIKDVRGTNYCDIYAYYDKRSEKVIVLSAIDNLMKGAAGQAVQNMNLLLDIDETTGLDQIPLRP